MKREEQVKQARNFAQELIGAGLKVYFRAEAEPNFTWGYFTDGKGIGYFQIGNLGEGMYTCHIPNCSTGTGFKMCDFLDVKFAQKSTWEFIEFAPRAIDVS